MPAGNGLVLFGAGGFLGQAVHAALPPKQRRTAYAHRGRAAADLRLEKEAALVLQTFQPSTVVHCAFPGSDGIGTMRDTPADLVHEQLLIDLHVIRACAQAGVRHLVTFGSVCAYPARAEVYDAHWTALPLDETTLLFGAPEALNGPYGHAKRMHLALLEAYARQEGLPATHLILDNLYGPGDASQHVIPATIRKCLTAAATGQREIVAWGDGTAEREFVYVEDAARAVELALAHPPAEAGVRVYNVVSSQPMAMRHIVDRVAATCGFTGTIRWDANQPVGQTRRCFDGSKAARELGWVATTAFDQGLTETVRWARTGGL